MPRMIDLQRKTIPFWLTVFEVSAHGHLALLLVAWGHVHLWMEEQSLLSTSKSGRKEQRKLHFHTLLQGHVP